jgi:hypothetical protein
VSEQNHRSVRYTLPAFQTAACSGSGPGLVPGRLRGYRRWMLLDSGRLESIAGYGSWGARGLTAECKATFHRAAAGHATPDMHCQCGIYGWYRPELIGDGMVCSCRSHHSTGSSFPYIVGAIDATGTILLGSKGFRAAKARIAGIVVEPTSYAATIVPTMHPDGPIFPTVEALVAALPPDDVAELGIRVDTDNAPASAYVVDGGRLRGRASRAGRRLMASSFDPPGSIYPRRTR